jgi:hypothetical protein
MAEVNKILAAYEAGGTVPQGSVVTPLTVSKFAGHFVATKSALAAIRRKRSVRTMMRALMDYFEASVGDVSTESSKAHVPRQKSTAGSGATGAHSAPPDSSEVEERRKRREDELIKGAIPQTKQELDAISTLLASLRGGTRNVKGPGNGEVDIKDERGFGEDRNAVPNQELVSSEDDQDESEEVRALDDGAALFFASCPLARYRKHKWTGTMIDLVQKVADTKRMVQTWDLLLMNKAKPLLPAHVRVCDPRTPDVVDSESPIELTKRYIRILRRFVTKHKNGAVSPKPDLSPLVRKRRRKSKTGLFGLKVIASAPPLRGRSARFHVFPLHRATRRIRQNLRHRMRISRRVESWRNVRNICSRIHRKIRWMLTWRVRSTAWLKVTKCTKDITLRKLCGTWGTRDILA